MFALCNSLCQLPLLQLLPPSKHNSLPSPMMEDPLYSFMPIEPAQLGPMFLLLLTRMFQVDDVVSKDVVQPDPDCVSDQTSV